jgi:hypothetical protein
MLVALHTYEHLLGPDTTCSCICCLHSAPLAVRNLYYEWCRLTSWFSPCSQSVWTSPGSQHTSGEPLMSISCGAGVGLVLSTALVGTGLPDACWSYYYRDCMPCCIPE